MALSFSRTRNFLQEGIAVRAFPGAAAAVGNREAVLLNAFSGSTAATPPAAAISPATLFDLASLTKVMATTLVTLRLFDRGRLDLFYPLSRYMEVPADKAGITLFQILSHTAGFAAHFLLQASHADPEHSLQTILQSPLAAKPGSQVIYSCIGYILLGKLLEKLCEEPLDQLTQRWVLDPLRMDRTGFCPRKSLDGQVAGSEADVEWFAATEWDPDKKIWLRGVVHDENARFLGGVSGNAGLFAPLEDCCSIAAALLNQPIHFLPRPLYEAMMVNQTAGKGDARGLGLAVWDGAEDWLAGPLLGPGACGHTGFTGTSLYLSPSRGYYFILLTNRVHYGRNLPVWPRYRAMFHEAALSDLA